MNLELMKSKLKATYTIIEKETDNVLEKKIFDFGELDKDRSIKLSEVLQMTEFIQTVVIGHKEFPEITVKSSIIY